MIFKNVRWMALALAAVLPAAAFAASETSVLVSILVRKGILTEEEAREVVAEMSAMTGAAATDAIPVAEATPDIVGTPVPEAKPARKEPVYVAAASKIATGFKLGGRLQVQYAGLDTDIDGTDDDPAQTRHFFLRRVYLGTSVNFGEQWSAKVTYDFAGAGFDAAYLRFEADDQNLFDFGLRKVNFAYEETLSSGSIPGLERSGLTRYFVETNNGRRLGAGSYRVGAFYEGESGNLFYGASVTNPERPINAVDAAAQGDVFNNGLAFWANGGIKTKYEGGSAIFGAAFGYMKDQGAVVGTGQDLSVGSIYTDAKMGGLRLIAEVLAADDGVGHPWGYSIQPIFAITPTLEGVVRLSYVDSDGRGIRLSDGVRSAPSGGTSATATATPGSDAEASLRTVA